MKTRVCTALLLIFTLLLTLGLGACSEKLTDKNSVLVSAVDKEGNTVFSQRVKVKSDVLNALTAFESAAQKADVLQVCSGGFPASINGIGGEVEAGWLMFVDGEVLRASMAEKGLSAGQTLEARFVTYADYFPAN
ncbi:MAG: hypothetical protein IKD06_05975 [Clostridia bacterium]|nr:hypothetical protein [Clostridia bacterium]